MTQYDFERLGPNVFEHLVVALAQRNIARGVRPYGSGTDGGREFTFDGRMDYPAGALVWEGYLVGQCKHKAERSQSKKDEATWAIDQLDREMIKYQNGQSQRRTPDFFLFITNAELSAKLDTGGKDRFVKRLDHWVKVLGIQAADVWDRDKLAALLNADQEIARRFGLLHAGDLLADVAERVLADRADVDATLQVFLQRSLLDEQFVRLGQAGHVADDRTPLSKVFVDLQADAQVMMKVTQEGRKYRRHHSVHVIKTIQAAAERPLAPSLTPSEPKPWLANGVDIEWDGTARFTIVGGPGQGKSTLTQHLAQRHRAALLDRRPIGVEYQARQAVRRECQESCVRGRL